MTNNKKPSTRKPPKEGIEQMSENQIVTLDRNTKATIAALTDSQLESIGLMRLCQPTMPPEISLFPEVQAAAKWWRDILAGPVVHDNGDELQTVMMTLLGHESTRVPSESLDSFEAWLAAILQLRYTAKRPGDTYRTGWQPSDPNFGSYTRSISNDYHPDMVLIAAARRAGILGELSNRFPCKTCMWVNPGSVTVRYGYGAPTQVIYPPEIGGTQ